MVVRYIVRSIIHPLSVSDYENGCRPECKRSNLTAFQITEMWKRVVFFLIWWTAEDARRAKYISNLIVFMSNYRDLIVFESFL